jgi:hypothetical protein
MARHEPAAERMLKTLGYVLVDDLLVACVSRSTPSDDDWDEWIARAAKVEYRGMLIATAGGSPNSAQRARLARAINKLPGPRPPVVLLTDSALMRSVMTAFSWLLGSQQPAKALPPSALAEALQWMDIALPPAHVQNVIDRLYKVFPGPRSATRA